MMQHDRLDFVFGPGVDPADWDIDDPGELHELALERLYDLPIGFGPMSDEIEDAIARVLVEVFASILEDEPSEAWAAAQRGLDAGIDPAEVLAQIFGVYRAEVVALAMQARNPDVEIPDRAAQLTNLPFAPTAAVREWLVDHLRTHGATPHDALLIAAAAAFGRPDLTIGEDADIRFDAFRDHLERAVDGLMQDADGFPDRWGEVTYVGEDSLVHVPTLFAGMVLTTRVGDPAPSDDLLPVEVDLAGFLRVPVLTYDGFPILQLPGKRRSEIRWLGTPGWLDPFAGSLVAVRVDADGAVSMERRDLEPAVDPSVVDALAVACRDYTETVDQAADMDDILVQMRITDPAVLSTPQPPLSELAAAAGLEQRDQEFADDSRLFRMSEGLRRHGSIRGRVRDPFLASEIELALTHISRWQDEQDGVDYGEHQPPPADLQVMLRAVGGDNPPVFPTFVEQWFGQRLPVSPAVAPVARELADVAAAALAVATRGRPQAAARLLLCCAHERLADPIAADAHLQLAAEADPGWSILTARLAWYALDRGDLVRAAKLWRSLGDGRPNRDVEVIERATSAASAGEGSPKLGRNDPCWCGSGRKYKQCHLGLPTVLPLPERVPVMIRKFVGFLERRGTDALADMMDLAEHRAPAERTEDIAAAMNDPLVHDLMLTGTDWFDAFLAERGALLPDDERLLFEAWALRERSVFEVEAVRRGEGMSVRDVRTGDRHDVRERTFSTVAAPGMHVLSRVVPDGETNQFVGGVVEIPVGRDEDLIRVLDEGNPYELLSWLSDLLRPKAPQNREGEEMVACELELWFDDPEGAAGFLDDTYERMTDEEIASTGGDGAWVEYHPIADGERLVRAGLLLKGDQLTVRTNSNERAERILRTLATGLLEAGLDFEMGLDEREEVTLAEVATFMLVPTMWDDLDDDRIDVDALEASPGTFGDLGPRPARSSMGLTLPGLGDGPGGGDDAMAAAMEQIQTQMEDRWCDEEVPALGGVTPREAAADPTRRPDLVRLIESFERMSVPEGAITFRPERLRKVLGL